MLTPDYTAVSLEPLTGAGRVPERIETGIPGCYLERLREHLDARGGLFECHRLSWVAEPNESQVPGLRIVSTKANVAQVYVSITRPDVVKGWHLHRRQTDRWVVVRGRIEVRLCDLQPYLQNGWDLDVVVGAVVPAKSLHAVQASLRRLVLDADRSPMRLVIPPGVAHGWYNRGPGDAWVLNMVSHEYDGTDEFRRPPGDGPCRGVAFDWRERIDG